MRAKALLSALVMASVSTLASAAVKVDSAAPEFTLTNSHGESVSLEQFAGKQVILEWTNHLCPYVQKHYSSDNMQALQTQYTGEDVVWLSIISSAPGKQGYVDSDTANALTKDRNAAPSHVLFDPEGTVGKAYGAKTTPHMYLIDSDGILRYAGAIDSIKSANPEDIPKSINYVTSGMTALEAGGSPDPKLTAPYGCSIKYKG
ncbi:redoxin domain-containing protein [Ferrimonas marina]|uniref:Peroxiredoxin n=1 Tax=Ferrimonas marina TaxID=299255 RepID=A0A1M5VW93_9GAMM|nr:redoxin domain-containing protein [Ferrimonas marina]SHH79478.1 Peroxiredoxin [Ferrimonas marina]